MKNYHGNTGLCRAELQIRGKTAKPSTSIERQNTTPPVLEVVKFICHLIYRKSLKISKGYSEVVNRRRTDNAMIKRKMTKGRTMIYKTLHRKIKIERNEPH